MTLLLRKIYRSFGIVKIEILPAVKTIDRITSVIK